MSAKTRSKHYDRMSQAKLDSLITRKPDPIFIEREHIEPKPILYSEEEYDSLHPEETIKGFTAAVREMLSRYEGNKERLEKLESQLQDLLHFVEMGKNKNAKDGFILYQKICEVRRERRVCKNEIDLLQPVYDAFSGRLMDILSRVQGECRTVKQYIDGKGYAIRTDVLDSFFK